MLFSCDVKDPIYNTPHPDHGKITLTTDWTNIGTSITVPASYTIRVGEYSATLSGITNTIDNLFTPGSYRANIHNTANGITVSGTTASVAADGANIDNMPGWLFFCAIDTAIEKDTKHELTAAMRQQVRQLTLVLTPKGSGGYVVSAVTGTLSGIAGMLDMDNNTYGLPSTVGLAFSKVSEGTDAGKWTATMRLLGVTGTEQKLNITVGYTDPSVEDQPLDPIDLTLQMTGFNEEKKTPFALGSIIETEKSISGFTTTVSDWMKITVTGEAEME